MTRNHLLQDHTAVNKQSGEGPGAVLGIWDTVEGVTHTVPALVELKSLVGRQMLGKYK